MNNLQSFESNNLSSQPQLLRIFDLGDKKGDSVESSDTLQSLVQSCGCGNGAEAKYSIRSPVAESECKNQWLRDYNDSLMSLKKNNCSSSISTFQQIASEKEAMKQQKRRRIRWTEDLHKRFMESIDRLGGPKKATPKAILKLMKCNGLTIFHVKSHLQKHRFARLIPDTTAGNAEQTNSKTGVQIVEALRLQMDVQRSLHEQLESQKKLQIRIEEQVKQLRTMLIQSQLNTKL